MDKKELSIKRFVESISEAGDYRKDVLLGIRQIIDWIDGKKLEITGNYLARLSEASNDELIELIDEIDEMTGGQA